MKHIKQNSTLTIRLKKYKLKWSMNSIKKSNGEIFWIRGSEKLNLMNPYSSVIWRLKNFKNAKEESIWCTLWTFLRFSEVIRFQNRIVILSVPSTSNLILPLSFFRIREVPKINRFSPSICCNTLQYTYLSLTSHFH